MSSSKTRSKPIRLVLNPAIKANRKAGELFLPTSPSETQILLSYLPPLHSRRLSAWDHPRYETLDDADDSTFPLSCRPETGTQPTTYYPMSLISVYPSMTDDQDHLSLAEGRMLYLALHFIDASIDNAVEQDRLTRHIRVPVRDPMKLKLALGRAAPALRYYKEVWHGTKNCPLFATLYIASIQSLVQASLNDSSYRAITSNWGINEEADYQQALSLLKKHRLDLGNIFFHIPFDPDTKEGEFLATLCDEAVFEDFKDVSPKAPQTNCSPSVPPKPKPKPKPKKLESPLTTPVQRLQPVSKSAHTSNSVFLAPHAKVAISSATSSSKDVDRGAIPAPAALSATGNTKIGPSLLLAADPAITVEHVDKSKKRKASSTTKTVPGHSGKKPRTVTPEVEDIKETAKLDGGHDDMIPRQLDQLLPLLSQLYSTTSHGVYLHPSLSTSEDFKLSKPAHTIIPEKDTPGPRKVRVKRPPTWKLEPELALFGAYYQANGIDYSPSDISTLAQSIPDPTDVAYGRCLSCLTIGDGSTCVPGNKYGEKCTSCKSGNRVCSHNWRIEKRAELFDATYVAARSGPQGFKDVLQAFGEARDAYDSLLNVVNDSQKALAKAHDRLVSEILSLRDAAANPGLFFQNLIKVYPKLVITYDLLCYYATLFDWNSLLNFSSVIQRHTTVAAWLKSNNVPLSIEEPMTTGPMKQIS